MARAGRGRLAKRAMVAMSFPCRTSPGRDVVSCGVDIHVAHLAAGYVTGAGSSRQQGRTPAGRRSAAPTRSASKICRSTLATASAVVDGKGGLTTCTEASRKAKPRKHQAGCQGGRQGSSHCLRATLAISESLRATAALASPRYGHPYLLRCGMSGCNAHPLRTSRRRCYQADRGRPIDTHPP